MIRDEQKCNETCRKPMNNTTHKLFIQWRQFLFLLTILVACMMYKLYFSLLMKFLKHPSAPWIPLVNWA